MGRRLAMASALVVALFLLGRVGFWLLFEQPEPVVAVIPIAPVVPVAPVAPPPIEKLRIVELEGTVERSAADAGWARIGKGDELREDESIRTDAKSRLVLEVGSAATVEVGPESRFSVQELTHTVAKVKLDQGRIGAVVHGDAGTRLQVGTAGSEAIAESGAGEFAVLASGKGRLVVATIAGSVRLSVNGQGVEVKAGEQSTAKKGLAPSAPEAIPASLFLKVNRPAALVQREKQTSISGSTVPGAVISINGVRVETDEQGAFTAVVPLTEGKNAVRVEAVGILGNQESAALPEITVKSQIAEVNSTMTWSKKKKDDPGKAP